MSNFTHRKIVLFLTVHRISVGFQKTDSPKYSAYVQRCLRELESANEFDSDGLLIQLVKIQRLTEQIHEMNTRVDGPDEIPGMPKAPLAAYQRAFQGELDRIQSFLTDDLKENGMRDTRNSLHSHAGKAFDDFLMLTNTLQSLSYVPYEPPDFIYMNLPSSMLRC